MDHGKILCNQSSSISSQKRIIFSAVAAICKEAGFTNVNNYVLDILAQMFCSFLMELGKNAKAFCEHAGRSEPLPNDIFMALIEMGFDISSIMAYAQRPNRIIIPNPTTMTAQPTSKILQTENKKPLSNYIPDYYPPFPDSHSYIATPSFKQPHDDYESLREKYANQKRDVELGLTNFIAQGLTERNPEYCLYLKAQTLLPLIPVDENDDEPYISALLAEEYEENQLRVTLQNQLSNNTNTNTANEDLKLNDAPMEENESEKPAVDNPYLLPAKPGNLYQALSFV